MEKRFTEWYSRCIVQEPENGKDVDSMNIQLKMSILECLHAQWIIELYNYFTQSEGREITSNGEQKNKGTRHFDSLASIDPLSEEVDSIDFAVTLNTEIDSSFVPKNHDKDDDDTWVNENEEPINNIFDLMDDM